MFQKDAGCLADAPCLAKIESDLICGHFLAVQISRLKEGWGDVGLPPHDTVWKHIFLMLGLFQKDAGRFADAPCLGI